jgi:hypothetical protein
VAVISFDGNTIAQVAAHGVPTDIAFSGSTGATGAALMSIAHSEGISLASMQTLQSGSAGKGAMVKLDVASKKGAIAYHFWCAHVQRCVGSQARPAYRLALV